MHIIKRLILKATVILLLRSSIHMDFLFVDEGLLQPLKIFKIPCCIKICAFCCEINSIFLRPILIHFKNIAKIQFKISLHIVPIRVFLARVGQHIIIIIRIQNLTVLQKLLFEFVFVEFVGEGGLGQGAVEGFVGVLNLRCRFILFPAKIKYPFSGIVYEVFCVRNLILPLLSQSCPGFFVY